LTGNWIYFVKFIGKMEKVKKLELESDRSQSRKKIFKNLLMNETLELFVAAAGQKVILPVPNDSSLEELANLIRMSFDIPTSELVLVRKLHPVSRKSYFFDRVSLLNDHDELEVDIISQKFIPSYGALPLSDNIGMEIETEKPSETTTKLKPRSSFREKRPFNKNALNSIQQLA
jgi:hypothetical protein